MTFSESMLQNTCVQVYFYLPRPIAIPVYEECHHLTDRMACSFPTPVGTCATPKAMVDSTTTVGSGRRRPTMPESIWFESEQSSRVGSRLGSRCGAPNVGSAIMIRSLTPRSARSPFPHPLPPPPPHTPTCQARRAWSSSPIFSTRDRASSRPSRALPRRSHPPSLPRPAV